ncbi:hypothetical protein PIB30_051817 [Stylosanthes scabra]|uniref:Uncharacterized protein n=1 Tax=Stylosanthes scabra TaxID=79078 RepID=A0ABU6WJN4_9FABA|nr:hypothetical protein [Stylosanthes scabra]
MSLPPVMEVSSATVFSPTVDSGLFCSLSAAVEKFVAEFPAPTSSSIFLQFPVIAVVVVETVLLNLNMKLRLMIAELMLDLSYLLIFLLLVAAIEISILVLLLLIFSLIHIPPKHHLI